METRVITIINQRTQAVNAIETDASTLGELKAALRAQNIDYDGQVFHECISNVELSDDSSLLPTNVPNPETGEPTNEIVISLTTQKKHISNGAMSRNELYALVKKNNLSAAIKEKYGKNFTNMSTDALAKAVEELSAKPKAAPKAEVKAKVKPEEKTEVKTEAKQEAKKADSSSCACVEFCKDICQILIDSKLVSYIKLEPISKKYGISLNKPTAVESPYSATTLRRFNK